MRAQIVFASVTGSDEDMTEILEEDLQDVGFDVENVDVSFADATSHPDASLCVMVTYTYGEGVMTDELKGFCDQLITLDPSDKRFAVIGSGDETYKDHYCENVDGLEKTFIRCGAVEVAKPIRIENVVGDEGIGLIDQAAEEIVEAFND